MASLSMTKRKGKTCYQIWIGSEPERFNIWLGKISKSQANEIFSHVVQLETSLRSDTGIRDITQQWLSNIDDKLYEKLVNANLAEPKSSLKVKEFFDEQLKIHECADRTRDIYRRALAKFYDYLDGENPLLRKVTPKQAFDFYNGY